MPATKRKRATSNAATRATIPATKPDAIPQPSSRDASDEDAEDPVLQEVSQLKQKQEPSSKHSGLPKLATGEHRPAKQPMLAKPIADTNGVVLEPVSRKGEEALGMKMAPPPKGGTVDPAGGYHTNPPPKGRPVRIYADGVFDLFHLGHMRVLEQAKKAFPNVHLTVGVTGDEETIRRKGLTVLSAKERAESVRHCRWVDAVIEDCPWVLTPEFMAEHGFDYVAHDDIPYGAAEGDDIYAPFKKQGQFLVTQRTEGVSTTGIITKVVRDYEQYLSRQLKRGTTRQELNISWLKKNEVELRRHVAELREAIRTNWTTTGQEIGRDLLALFPLSRSASPAPTPSSSSRLRTNGIAMDEEAGGSGALSPKSPLSRSASAKNLLLHPHPHPHHDDHEGVNHFDGGDDAIAAGSPPT